MTWLVWRQHRTQALVTAALLVVLGVLLWWQRADSATLLPTFHHVLPVVPWLVVVPALVGLFWGAPVLALEYEHSSQLLAWTQSVSRRRWALAKLGVLGGGVVVAGLAYGTMWSAWSAGFAELPESGLLANQDLFMLTGLVPAAWWLFVFAAGVAAGAVLRRLLPAVAATLVVFAVGYAGMSILDVREHYAQPVRVEPTELVAHGDEWNINTQAGVGWNVPPGALIVDAGWVDGAGRRLSTDETWACASHGAGYFRCMADRSYQWFAEFQPADRYWRFQWTEAGILVAASLVLGVLTLRRVG